MTFRVYESFFGKNIEEARSEFFNAEEMDWISPHMKSMARF